MLYPTIQDLTHGNFNRYELVIATAKCARLVTNEYVHQRENAERALVGFKDSEKAIANMIDKEYRDEKAVKVAINHILSGDYIICHEGDYPEEKPAAKAIYVARTFTFADKDEDTAPEKKAKESPVEAAEQAEVSLTAEAGTEAEEIPATAEEAAEKEPGADA